jgi:hypothetical protein
MAPSFSEQQLAEALREAFPDKDLIEQMAEGICQKYEHEDRSAGPWKWHEAEDYDVTRGGEKWTRGVFSSKRKKEVETIARVLNQLEGQGSAAP